MLSLINWRLKVTINDGRAFVGQMLAFDRHMNLVLAECEEFRRVRPKKKAGETEAGPMQEMKRTLGLVILRGETVVSLSVESPPPATDDDKKNVVRIRKIHEFWFGADLGVLAAIRSWTGSTSRPWHADDASWCVYFLLCFLKAYTHAVTRRCSWWHRAPAHAICASWHAWPSPNSNSKGERER